MPGSRAPRTRPRPAVRVGAACRQRIASGAGMRVAVVDIGTNSTRLLIADVEPGPTVTERHRESIVTRLGEGVDATGRLGEEPQSRVFAALERYAAEIAAHECDAS